MALVNSMNREKMLKQVLGRSKTGVRLYSSGLYCRPLGMLTVNALAAADNAADTGSGSSTFLQRVWNSCLETINKVKRQINPKLKIEGILLTMTDSRTNYGKQIDNSDSSGHTVVKSRCSTRPFPGLSVLLKPVPPARAFSSMTPRARWQKPINLLRRLTIKSQALK